MPAQFVQHGVGEDLAGAVVPAGAEVVRSVAYSCREHRVEDLQPLGDDLGPIPSPGMTARRIVLDMCASVRAVSRFGHAISTLGP